MSEENVVEEEFIEEEVDTEAVIREAFDEAISDEADEDSVKMAMIGAGATFKNVTRLYNQFMIDAGLAISKEDRNKAVEDALEGRDFDTEENFSEAVDALLASVTGSTERSAAALVRSYAKKNELDCYAKPKGTGATRSGFTSKLHDLLASNPDIAEEEFVKFVNGEGDYEDTSDNVKKHLSLYLGIWKLVQRVAEKARA